MKCWSLFVTTSIQKPAKAAGACGGWPSSAKAGGSGYKSPSLNAKWDRAQFEALERSLVEEIKVDEDNLRFYRIAELKGYEVREHGRFRATDFDAPLVL